MPFALSVSIIERLFAYVKKKGFLFHSTQNIWTFYFVDSAGKSERRSVRRIGSFLVSRETKMSAFNVSNTISGIKTSQI